MKKSLVTLMLVSQLLSIPFNTIFGDDKLPVAPVSLSPLDQAGIKGVLGIQAGDYSFVTFDKGILQKTFLDETILRSQQDRGFVKKSVENIETMFINLVSNHTNGNMDGSLKQMSDLSISQEGYITPFKDFISAINSYNMAKLALETRINSLKTMTESLPSKNLPMDGSGLSQIGAPLSIDFSPLQTFYAEKLTNIEQLIQNLPFRINLKNNTPKTILVNSGHALSYTDLAVTYTAKEIMQFQKDIKTKLSWSSEQKGEILNPFTGFLKQKTQKFIESYSQRYRVLTPAIVSSMDKDYQELIEAFWVRSYLRAIYGRPLGAVGIDYQERIGLWFANADHFVNSTSIVFKQEVIWDENSFIEIGKDLELMLETMDPRSKAIITNGNAHIVDRIASLITYVKGERNQSAVVQNVLKLLAADFYEEREISKAGGVEEMLARYKERYYSTDEDSKLFKGLLEAYDPSGDTDTSDVAYYSSSNLRGQYDSIKMLAQAKSVEADEARAIQAELQLAIAKSKETKGQNARRDLLR